MSEPKAQLHSDGDTGDDYDQEDSQPRGDDQEEGDEPTPSKVVHVRGLPRGVVEGELVSFAVPFGNVIKTLIIQTKGQAFLEMDSVDAARKVVDYYSKTESNLRGRRIFFQFSNRDEIKVRDPPPGRVSPTELSSSKLDGQERVSKILLVSILDCRVSITIENLYTVFSPYGEVDKIVTFVKNNIFKALIQFRYIESAINAKVALDGKNMYHGCCLFQIVFSRLLDLQVKTNTPRSRDFTGPLAERIPEKYPPTHFQTTPLGFLPPTSRGYPPATTTPKQPLFPAYPPGYDASTEYMASFKGSVLLVTNLVEQKVTPEVLFNLFGVYGDVERVKIFYNKQHTALVQMADPYQASLAQMHLNHVVLFGKAITIIPSKHSAVSLPHPSLQKVDSGSNLARDFSGSPFHRFRYNRNYRVICPPGPVLHVSNLSEETSAEELRSVFGPKVTAVQFFKTDRRMAFVRLSSIAEAVAALVRLHCTKVGGKTIKVSFSPKKPGQIENDLKAQESSDQSSSTDPSYDSASSKSTKPKSTTTTASSSTTKPRAPPATTSTTSTLPSSTNTRTQARSTAPSSAPVHTSSSTARAKPAQGQPQSRPTGVTQSRVVGGPAPRSAPRSAPQPYYPIKQEYYGGPEYYEQPQGYRDQKRQ